MRWIALLASFFVLTGSALAAGADDQYLDIYNQINQGDTLLQNGQSAAAAERYAQAQAALTKLHADLPDWNPEVVKFRLDYLAGKLQDLAKFMPANGALIQSNGPAAVAPLPAPTPVSPAFEQQISALQEQIRSLTDANADLGRRLKEALSVQPAATSPAELAREEAKIVALQKEKDLLTVEMAQAKASHATGPTPSISPADQAELGRLKDALADSEKKLAEANSEIDSLRAARPVPTQAPESPSDIIQERDNLRVKVVQLSKDLADSEAHQQALQAPVAASNEEADQLRAKLAVLEANPVPYTAEELAIIKQGAAQPPAQLPAPSTTPVPPTTPPPETKRVVHSSKDLPPGAGALMAEGARAFMERDFEKAEQKYQAILNEDENNVYVLTYLANAQYSAGHLADAEKTVKRALDLDPNDPATLFLLGILRYRQENLDAAFDALSRSALYNPTNAGTQNYLGCVLADKGLRPAAETAFRKALQADPEYADAHYNLALVYATETPPSPELARWHYQRAVELGHPKSPKMEKLLSGDKQ